MSDKQTIWNLLLADIGNEFGVAALMGNLKAESNLQSNNLENGYESSSGFTDETYTKAVDNGSYSESSFVNDAYGYGLAQWTYYSRKQGLYNMWKSGGYSSISSLDLQVTYLLYELKNSYSGVYSTLKSATSIRTASDSVLHDFENPADQSTSVEEYRASLGQAIYDELKGTSGETETIVFTPRTSKDGINGSYYWYDGNPFHWSDKGLPNCTCYAYGRFWEISDLANGSQDYDRKPEGLCLSHAYKWIDQSTGFETGSEPKLGAIACWHGEDGEAGHVAVVEEIKDNGDIVVSQSAWTDDNRTESNSLYFYMSTRTKANNYYYENKNGNGRYFQGFIYNPYVYQSGGGDVPIIPPDPIPAERKKRKKNFKFVLYGD